MTHDLIILGATGSIGRAALDVVRQLRNAGTEIRIVGLSARANAGLLAEQVREFRPRAVAVGSPGAAQAFRDAASPWRGTVLAGPDAVVELAGSTEADLVLVAVDGVAGLPPALAALESGKSVALATKEALVAGGELITAAASRAGRRILPVDSEHSAIFQCLAGRAPDDVARLWITASGGPFRRWSSEQMAMVTPDEALRHPTWKMGKKVTVDSSTLMNKGLEIIEAHWLFGIPGDRIEIVIHPQSLVHSLVEFVDRSILAQLGPTDMRLPIQYALTYPQRRPAPLEPLDVRRLGTLEFEPPDLARFPCLGHAREALRRGGTAPAVLNAADEVAVRLFLDGRIGFVEIAQLVGRTLARHRPRPAASLEAVMAADAEAREQVRAAVRRSGARA